MIGGDAFFGKSKNGLYGDSVEEVDWSTGELLKSIRELGLEKDTIIVFTSDNGPLMRGESGARSPHKAFYYYFSNQLKAVRSGKWKLHLALDPSIEKWTMQEAGKVEAKLYDLEADPAESDNVIAAHPDVVKRLEALADRARADIGDYPEKGDGFRPTLVLDKAVPLPVPETARLPFPEPPSDRPSRPRSVSPGR